MENLGGFVEFARAHQLELLLVGSAIVNALLALHRPERLVAGRLLGNHEAWPSLLWRDYWRGALSAVNMGVPGQTVTMMIADDPAKLDGVQDLSSPRVLVVAAGINDLLAGDTGATVWGRLQTHYAMAVARGWRVVATTVADAPGLTSGQRTQLLALNGLISAGYLAAGATALADIYAAAPTVGADNIHYDSAGAATVAGVVGPVADTLLV